MAFGNPIIGGESTLIREAIRSPNYVPGVSGWTINKNGTVEFSDGTFRGSVQVNGPDNSYLMIDASNGFPDIRNRPLDTGHAGLDTAMGPARIYASRFDPVNEGDGFTLFNIVGAPLDGAPSGGVTAQIELQSESYVSSASQPPKCVVTTTDDPSTPVEMYVMGNLTTNQNLTVFGDGDFVSNLDVAGQATFQNMIIAPGLYDQTDADDAGITTTTLVSVLSVDITVAGTYTFDVMFLLTSTSAAGRPKFGLQGTNGLTTSLWRWASQGVHYNTAAGSQGINAAGTSLPSSTGGNQLSNTDWTTTTGFSAVSIKGVVTCSQGTLHFSLSPNTGGTSTINPKAGCMVTMEYRGA